MRLSAIDVQAVRNFAAEMVELVEAGELAPKTVNNTLSCLSTCLKDAVALHKIPCRRSRRSSPSCLGSSVTLSESGQTMRCTYPSAALRVGLLANAVAGWWWANPLVALGIGAVACREARGA